MSSRDKSNGYEACASTFIRTRNPRIGTDIVREWAPVLPKGAAVLDLGCGYGVPISEVLLSEGCALCAIDASPTMIAEFRRRFPACQTECAALEDSKFFARKFHGVVAWGLVFLLKANLQSLLIQKVANALYPGGQFLFTSPREPSAWQDSLTGRESISLGADRYRRILRRNGLALALERMDEGKNHYYFATKRDV